ncbi:nitrate reductase molybdenum cofactor assembly chaperone [Thalassobacillus pellis]|uniref:nitrate reductase molybdenum cofactor assembly chaperone n=1 Tax=Thalassobacillus pellis TaxID=748008 RepID=UPI001EF840E0|nr:nitrate reductase molybdenum cofactor assembly chaperone [Thalassobacillus pellis]MBM7551960.1 nitrate reductase delta subunit [Thalassobacillus pellis]
MEDNRNILKLCSIFLRYPEEEWYQQEETYQFIKSLKDSPPRKNLEYFWNYVTAVSWLEYCQNYVKQFDFSREHSLYLTYGVFGDKRERGLGFVKLKLEFAKAGYFIKDDELPDYFPLILEFLSEAEDEFIQKLYYIHKKAIDQLYAELKNQRSPYAYVVAAALETLDTIVASREAKTIGKG